MDSLSLTYNFHTDIQKSINGSEEYRRKFLVINLNGLDDKGSFNVDQLFIPLSALKEELQDA